MYNALEIQRNNVKSTENAPVWTIYDFILHDWKLVLVLWMYKNCMSVYVWLHIKKWKKNIQCDKCFTFRESSINKFNLRDKFFYWKKEWKGVCKSKNALQRHEVEDCKRIIIYGIWNIHEYKLKKKRVKEYTRINRNPIYSTTFLRRNMSS